MIDVQSKLKELWEGNIPLVQTFWLYYFFGVFFLSWVGIGMKLAFVNLIAVLWAGYMAAPIWRAANNYEGLSLYAKMAKVAAVIIALIAISRLTSYGRGEG
jgi:hypothetical protein